MWMPKISDMISENSRRIRSILGFNPASEYSSQAISGTVLTCDNESARISLVSPNTTYSMDNEVNHRPTG